MATKKKTANTYKVGRDTTTGRFIPIKDAERRKKTAVIQTIKKSAVKRSKLPKPMIVHVSKGVSGSTIIKELKINKKAVKAAEKIIEKTFCKKSKNSRKKVKSIVKS